MSLACNYRLVSLTCIPCKLLEHSVFSNIMGHLDQYNLLSDKQHAFRKGHSCENIGQKYWTKRVRLTLALCTLKIEASYTLEGTVLENVDSVKYLGVTITNDLKWNTNITNICAKANRTLGFLR